jgi:hypothetical protein
MFVVANDSVVSFQEEAIVGKNSPKSRVSGGCSDGAIDVFGLSPALGGGAGGDTSSPEDTFLSFPLENVDLSLLDQMTVGQPVDLVPEAESRIAATTSGRTIGYVPGAYRMKVAAVLRQGAYSALIEDIAHHTVRVRVTS